jgi:histidyl-tRNA synthetase
VGDRIQAIRGMNDILPPQSSAWRKLEKILASCLHQYGYEEIQFPIVESTQLFKRSIGEITDIVEKEMYTFTDLNGDSLTLRPEGTAGCLRACLEHGLLHNQQQKIYYIGPMFRHEKPQKGRYRQFHQIGIEAIGIPGYAIELELIALCKRLWKELSIEKELELQISSLGESSERQAYKAKLVQYLTEHKNQLDEDSLRRLHKNPLRILDSKNPNMHELLSNAPKLLDCLGENSKSHFANLCNGLESMGISYTINPRIVRGLDYYGHTVFEWVTDKLGSQATVCGGGRYDALIEQLGGRAMPAIGLGMGVERILLLLETLGLSLENPIQPSVFIMANGDDALRQALNLAEKLRNLEPSWCIVTNTSGGSFKSQFKKADKSNAKIALILGEEELRDNLISIKNLRSEVEQITIPQNELHHNLIRIFSGEK